MLRQDSKMLDGPTDPRQFIRGNRLETVTTRPSSSWKTPPWGGRLSRTQVLIRDRPARATSCSLKSAEVARGAITTSRAQVPSAVLYLAECRDCPSRIKAVAWDGVRTGYEPLGELDVEVAFSEIAPGLRGRRAKVHLSACSKTGLERQVVPGEPWRTE